MRCLLVGASLCSCVLIALTAAMWDRSIGGTDWLRVNALDGSAVLACSQKHVGAAVVTDARNWRSDGRPVRYRHFEAIDMRSKFNRDWMGFGYRRDDGVHFLICPLWFIAAMSIVPPATFFATRHTPLNRPRIQVD